jgi:photosystem I subunit 3
MRHVFAVALAVVLWMGFAPTAQADLYANLTPCGDNPAFVQRAKAAQTPKDQARFERYSTLLCGEEGLPHLIADGNLGHLSEFVIPGLAFLYIAGWIGWSGRSYLQAAQKTKSPEEMEIIINVPLAVKCSLGGATWPLAAFGEFSSGAMFAKESEITVSPR